MKKFEKNFIVLCDHTIQDISGKISLIGIFENISSKEIPAIISSFAVAGNVRIVDEKTNSAEIILKMTSQTGINVLQNQPPLKIAHIPLVEKNKRRSINFIFKLVTVPFEQGIYSVSIEINEEKIGETELEVIKI